MKSIKLAIKFLLKGKNRGIVKLLSLTLGLSVGLIVTTRVAYDLSYDGFYPDKERTYRLEVRSTFKMSEEEDVDVGPIVQAPIAPTMALEIPSVEAGTTVGRPRGVDVFYHKNKFNIRALQGDSCLFDVISMPMVQGDPKKLLAVTDNVLVSRSTAKLVFGEKDPVGEILLYNDSHPYTIAGVFEDFPINSHMGKIDAILSFNNVKEQFGMYTGWGGGDSFWGYVKLAPGTDPRRVEEAIPAMIAGHNSHFDPQTE